MVRILLYRPKPYHAFYIKPPVPWSLVDAAGYSVIFVKIKRRSR